MIKWIKNKIAEWKYKRKMKKKLEELKKKDPFIYDQKRKCCGTLNRTSIRQNKSTTHKRFNVTQRTL